MSDKEIQINDNPNEWINWIEEAIDKEYFTVATGNGEAINILDLQPAGKKRMTAMDYLRGTGSKLQIGDRFE